MAPGPIPSGGLPRITFETVERVELAPLRTDIALFAGSAISGPVGIPLRIDGWRSFEAVFGGLSAKTNTGHALRGYFENGGRIAYVLRLAPGAQPASGVWDVVADGGFAPASLGHSRFNVIAATPGVWGDGLALRVTGRAGLGGMLINLDVMIAGRLAEQLHRLDPVTLVADVAARSGLVRIAPDPVAAALPPPVGAGPRARRWPEIALFGGTDGDPPRRADYVAALELAASEQEPALIALPDLHRHLGAADAAAVLLAAARYCDLRLDRMVVADAPEHVATRADAEAWIALFGNDPAIHRNVATYHPWIDMRDPIGTALAPLRRMPPSGHVTGAISRLDRELGAYVTPANASLREAIDLARRLEPVDQDTFSSVGLNAMRCQSARGIVLWGGRMTRSDDAPVRFIAHRRLMHRLVRALRRVWEPMVFEPNDDQLRFAIARSATTLLMEAFHANVLKGTRPDEAFRVDVGDTLNDQAARDAGQVYCEIAIAPAAPMEFIHFRVGLSADGSIEMVEP